MTGATTNICQQSWLRRAARWLIAGVMVITSMPTMAGLASCSDVLRDFEQKGTIGSPINVITAPNEIAGALPGWPLLGQGVVNGTQITCLMNDETSITIAGGPTIAKSTLNQQSIRDGDMWYAPALSYDWARDSLDAWCAYGPDEGANANSCLASRVTATGALICDGADGRQTTMMNFSNPTNFGGATGTVRCRDRGNGGGVTITTPGFNVQIYSNSGEGFTAYSYASINFKSNSAVGLPYYTLVIGRKTDIEGVATCTKTGNVLVTQPCKASPMLSINMTRSSKHPIGTCAARLSSNVLDWGTVSPGPGQTPGSPLIGVQAITTSVNINCTGTGANSANTIYLTAHGVDSAWPEVFASSNDSVGYRITAGTKNTTTKNGEPVLLTSAKDGVVFGPPSGNGINGTTQINVQPFALLTNPLPGLAKSELTLDIYAYES